MGRSNTDSIGYGAELYVRADLTWKGYVTHDSDLPTMPYDLIVICGGRFFKVQVKARSADESGKVVVDIRKSNGADRYYTEEDCDIIAVVEPSERLVAYLPASEWVGRSQLTLYIEDVGKINGTKTKDRRILFSEYSTLGDCARHQEAA